MKQGIVSIFNFYRRRERSSFTLIELLIVIGILAILAVTTVLVLNPQEMLKRSRDATRLSDLQLVNKSLSFAQLQGVTNFGSSNAVYVSIPDAAISGTSTAICSPALGLPALPAGWQYRCSHPDYLRRVDGTGWIPVKFSSITAGSPLDTLPIDPLNTTSTGNYYTYVPGGSWKLTSLFESEKYVKQMATDGGPDAAVFEIGSNLSLANFARGLVGYWKMDEGGTSATANDSSGNSNNGTLLNGPVWAVGQVGGSALQFNAGTAKVDAGGNSSLKLSGNMTISAWVKFTAPTYPDSSAHWTILSNETLGLSGYLFRMPAGLTKLYFRTNRTGGGFSGLYTNTNLQKNVWYHAVFVKNGIISTFYLNGNADNSSSAMLDPEPATTNFLIGNYSAGVINGMNGLIDDVRVYNRALSVSEIQAIYNVTK